MNYFDNRITRIAILEHEINHCSRRICDLYELNQDATLKNKEEAECYISEYIFEDIMSMMQPEIDYQKSPRNMNWFYEITQEIS